MADCSDLVSDPVLTCARGRRPLHSRLPPMRRFVAALHLAGILAALLIFDRQAEAAANSPEIQLAAAFELPQLPKGPGLPALTGPSADWRQFDAFFTFVVKRFADDVPANLKDSLGDAFLDSRYELTSAVAPGRGGNPVPGLFINGWG